MRQVLGEETCVRVTRTVYESEMDILKGCLTRSEGRLKIVRFSDCPMEISHHSVGMYIFEKNKYYWSKGGVMIISPPIASI